MEGFFCTFLFLGKIETQLHNFRWFKGLRILRVEGIAVRGKHRLRELLSLTVAFVQHCSFPCRREEFWSRTTRIMPVQWMANYCLKFFLLLQSAIFVSLVCLFSFTVYFFFVSATSAGCESDFGILFQFGMFSSQRGCSNFENGVFGLCFFQSVLAVYEISYRIVFSDKQFELSSKSAT